LALLNSYYTLSASYYVQLYTLILEYWIY